MRALAVAGAVVALAWPAPCPAQEISGPDQLRDKILSLLPFSAAKAIDAANQLAGKPNTQAVQCALHHLAWRIDWNNATARKFLGYEKDGWTWKRDEKRRGLLAEAVMNEGLVPALEQRKIVADCAAAQAAEFKKLANAARGRRPGKDAAVEKVWAELVRTLWEWVVWLDPSDEDGHRALGHPAPWGMYVGPWYVDAMQLRYQHERVLDTAGRDAAKDVHDDAASSDDAKIGVLGMARTSHVVVRSWTSLDHARGAASYLELAGRLLAAESPAQKDWKGWQVHLVANRDAMEAVVRLRAGAATSQAIQEGRTSAFASFPSADGTVHFVACDMAGVPALERVLARVARDAADAARLTDPWQREGFADLLVAEVMGRAEETFAGGPAGVEWKNAPWKRNALQPSPYREGTDLWAKERWLVVCDLDPPFSDVTFKEATEMTRADRMKAAGAVRFLKEYWRENKIAPVDKRVKDEYTSTATPTYPLWGRSFEDFDWQYRLYTVETR